MKSLSQALTNQLSMKVLSPYLQQIRNNIGTNPFEVSIVSRPVFFSGLDTQSFQYVFFDEETLKANRVKKVKSFKQFQKNHEKKLQNNYKNYLRKQYRDLNTYNNVFLHDKLVNEYRSLIEKTIVKINISYIAEILKLETSSSLLQVFTLVKFYKSFNSNYLEVYKYADYLKNKQIEMKKDYLEDGTFRSAHIRIMEDDALRDLEYMIQTVEKFALNLKLKQFSSYHVKPYKEPIRKI